MTGQHLAEVHARAAYGMITVILLNVLTQSKISESFVPLLSRRLFVVYFSVSVLTIIFVELETKLLKLSYKE